MPVYEIVDKNDPASVPTVVITEDPEQVLRWVAQERFAIKKIEIEYVTADLEVVALICAAKPDGNAAT